MNKTIEEMVENYAKSYEGILPPDAIERSKTFWREQLTQAYTLGQEDLLPYLKKYLNTLDCDWSVNPVQATTLEYRSPESVLRDQADTIERKRAEANELRQLITTLTNKQ